MIVINEIKEKPVTLFDPTDKEVGVISDNLQFNDVRLQIVRNKVKGYYILIDSGKFYLNPNGTIENADGGFNCDAFSKFTEIVMNIAMEAVDE